MTQIEWMIPPDEMGSFDCSVVRCIAGEFDESFLDRVTEAAGVDVRLRMAVLLQKHFHLKVDDLHGMDATKRRQLANDIVVTEMEERQTMPGPLVQLRTISCR